MTSAGLRSNLFSVDEKKPVAETLPQKKRFVRPLLAGCSGRLKRGAEISTG